MRAQDVLPDETNEVMIGGIAVRKGTIGAFLANARLLAEMTPDAAERAAVLDDIRQLLPSLRALGLFDVMAVKDPDLRAIVEAQS